MNRRQRALISGIVAVIAAPALVFGATPAWSADPISPPSIPDATDGGEYTAPTPRGLADSLKRSSGTVQVTVRLAEPAIAETVPEGAIADGTVPDASAQLVQQDKVTAQQDEFLAAAGDLGVTELARTDLAANLVAVSVEAGQLESLAQLPNVISVNPVRTYEKDAAPRVAAAEEPVNPEASRRRSSTSRRRPCTPRASTGRA